VQEIIRVKTAAGPEYPVLCGTDVCPMLGQIWRPHWRQAAIIGDQNTSKLFAQPLAEALRSQCERVVQLSFPAGELHKTRATKEELENALLETGFDRASCVVGVGGGIALDVAGYVAATYLRGVAHVNIATSLLAQVDAAVGGKTGVNTPYGKNLIGAFHQPRAVLIDIAALSSLPEVELRLGLAEAIKHAVLADEELFNALESWAASDAGPIPPEHLVARCVEIKAEVVMRDERELAYRQVLNFGHTVAHALESASDHRVPHGEAVASGMVVEARLAERLCGFPPSASNRLVALLRQLELPTEPAVSFAEAAPLLGHDKKTRQGVIHCALPERIGQMHANDGRWSVPVELELLEQLWGNS
jgi:3-dehydroquinate synthase